MGSKGDIKIPEAYDLDELLESQVKMNRFDAENPFGTQTWEKLDDGRFKMTQAVDPKLQDSMDRAFAFANRDAPQFRVQDGLRDTFNAFGGEVAKRAGMEGAWQNMQGKPTPAPPAEPPQTPADPPPAEPPPTQPPPQTGGPRPPDGSGFSPDDPRHPNYGNRPGGGGPPVGSNPPPTRPN